MKINTEVRGGEKLTKKLKQIHDRLKAHKRVMVGLPSSSGNYDEDGASVVVVGAVHEFGSSDGRIPERSFLRVPLMQNEDNLKKLMAALAGKVTRGEISAHQMLDQTGARAVGYCIEAIESGIEPPNAASTVRAKGSATPLVDTGILKSRITHVVEEPGDVR